MPDCDLYQTKYIVYLSMSFAILIMPLINISIGQNSFTNSMPLTCFISVSYIFLKKKEEKYMY